jgi:hypothetical protein
MTINNIEIIRIKRNLLIFLGDKLNLENIKEKTNKK